MSDSEGGIDPFLPLLASRPTNNEWSFFLNSPPPTNGDRFERFQKRLEFAATPESPIDLQARKSRAHCIRRGCHTDQTYFEIKQKCYLNHRYRSLSRMNTQLMDAADDHLYVFTSLGAYLLTWCLFVEVASSQKTLSFFSQLFLVH